MKKKNTETVLIKSSFVTAESSLQEVKKMFSQIYYKTDPETIKLGPSRYTGEKKNWLTVF